MGWQDFLNHMQKCLGCNQPFYMLTYAKMLPCMHSLCCDQCMAYYTTAQCRVCGVISNSLTYDPALEVLQKEISEFYYAQLSDKEKEDRAYVVAVRLNERLNWLVHSVEVTTERIRSPVPTGQENDSAPTEWRRGYASSQYAHPPHNHSVLIPEEAKTDLYQPLLPQSSDEFQPAPLPSAIPLAQSQPGAPAPYENSRVPDLSQVPDLIPIPDLSQVLMSELGKPVKGLWNCSYCGCKQNQGTRCRDCHRVNLCGASDQLPGSIEAILQPQEDMSCCPCVVCSIF